ncbi:uncharacterized protein BXIN_2420 [Babesia sp. Xinjiang]|uniref:uncharacterized protein n=1 Tax=Babesia sp. Xinjiang TaxID=462227 RepID=UPI000A22C02A|nr:uncharacterized protein BXIN_2420 [Babesia sp. Xinjiang]ORM40759.1 hypothetical protein BXIN_2420 [Babesia sp. Xinjiang]
MANTTSLLLMAASSALAYTTLAATTTKSGGALSAMMPHLVNSTMSALTGTAQQDLDTPRISLKVMPSKRIHLSPSEMNALLFTIKQEIHRKVRQLEEDLLERRHENEKHLSAWALNQAPVYMPFRDKNETSKRKHEPSLQMEVEKIKQKADARNSAGKPPVVQNELANNKKSEETSGNLT